MQISGRLGQSGPDPSPMDQLRSGVGGTSRRQSRHAESGVHYGGQVLSENTDTLPEPGGKGLRTGRAGKLQGET